MSKKLGGILALLGLCALSLFLVNCGSSSSRPAGSLYVLTQGINGFGTNVSTFSMDLDTGGLSLVNSNPSTCPTAATEQNPAPCGLPLDLVLDPTGATAFVLNQGTPCQQQGNQCVSGSTSILPTIFAYTVGSDGSLSAPGSPVYWTCVAPSLGPCSATSTGAYPDTAVHMVRDTAGQFLFVIDQGAFPAPTTCPAIASAANTAQDASNFVGCPSISVFSMQPGSTTLTPVSQSSTYQSPLFLSKVPSGISPITFSQTTGGSSQEFLFATNNYDLCTIGCLPATTPNDNTLSAYLLSSTGVLSEQTGSPYTVSEVDPVSVQAVNTNPAGQITGGIFVYVGTQGASAGALTEFQVCTPQVASCSQQQMTLNQLIPVTCAQISCANSAGQNPIAMVVDPTNNFLYSLAEGSNQIFAFKINPSSGTLTALAPANQSTGSQPVSLALHPSVNNTGQFLYTSNSNSDNISGFTLGTTSGSMSNAITVISPATPSGMAVH
jgi:Lactonase, 7-bladed beta-propeller